MATDSDGHYIPLCAWCHQPITQHSSVKRLQVLSVMLDGDQYIDDPQYNLRNFVYHPTCYRNHILPMLDAGGK